MSRRECITPKGMTQKSNVAPGVVFLLFRNQYALCSDALD